MTATIELESLGKRYGSTVAVEDVTATVHPGQVTAFLGPNGAGKTTTMRMVLGLVAPTSGTATIGGLRYEDLPDPVRQVGAALEASGFHPGRTALDHLRIIATAARLSRDAPLRALGETGLADDAGRRVGEFSLGMRQRLSLATAMLGDPGVLVLDEPTNGLDPEGVRWLRGYMRRLAGEGRTVLVSSHLLSEVEQTADHVLVIVGGRLVRSSPIRELRAEAGVGSRVRTPDARRLGVALDAAGHSYSQAGEELTVDAPAARVGEIAAAQGVVLHELTSTGGLEQAFFQLVQLSGTRPAPSSVPETER